MRNEIKTLDSKFIEQKYVHVPNVLDWIKTIDKKMTLPLKYILDTIIGFGMIIGIIANWNTWLAVIPVIVGAFYWIPMGLIRWEQYFKARDQRRSFRKNKRGR